MSIRNLIDRPLVRDTYVWSAEMRVQYHNERGAQLVLRLAMITDLIEYRSHAPEMRIGESVAYETTVNEFGVGAIGWFATLPEEQTVDLWIGDEVVFRSPDVFELEKIELLDLDRIDSPLIEDSGASNALFEFIKNHSQEQ